MLRLTMTIAALAAATTAALAVDIPAAMKPASQESNGKYMNAAGEPTYNVKEDGTIDWFTYSGFRMYHAECHVCHGPEGEGSSYAPRLVDSLKRFDYAQFMDVVTNGRQVNNAAQHSVMPAFGTNANVMCYIDDLYLYLKARADGVLPRGRPPKKEAKNDVARAEERQCLGVTN
jgi:methanol metabolism-related c-type cytochrome